MALVWTTIKKKTRTEQHSTVKCSLAVPLHLDVTYETRNERVGPLERETTAQHDEGRGDGDEVSC